MPAKPILVSSKGYQPDYYMRLSRRIRVVFWMALAGLVIGCASLILWWIR